jgi:hypothetical protein
MIAYHASWARSILDKKEIVEIGEFAQWIVLTLRLDPNMSSKMSQGLFAKYFLDKLFIRQDHFMNPGVTRTFIEMINLGFKKIYEAPKSEKTIVELMKSDVFHLVDKYYHYLREGIRNVEKTLPAEGIRLRQSFISNLLAYLMRDKSECKSACIAALWGYIFEGDALKTCLISPPGFTFDEVVNIMYWMIHNIPITRKDKYEYEIVINSLKSAYEEKKKRILKILSPSQIEEFEFVIYRLYKEEGGSGASGNTLKIPPK